MWITKVISIFEKHVLSNYLYKIYKWLETQRFFTCTDIHAGMMSDSLTSASAHVRKKAADCSAALTALYLLLENSSD